MLSKKLLFCLILAFVCAYAQAQTPAQNLATKIARKMKDSLALNEEQKNNLYEINMLLHNQKMQVRSLYVVPDSVLHYLQAVENSRDSLYQPVLTEQQYILYKEKKILLVSNQ
jgi:hypothetical protein